MHFAFLLKYFLQIDLSGEVIITYEVKKPVSEGVNLYVCVLDILCIFMIISFCSVMERIKTNSSKQKHLICNVKGQRFCIGVLQGL